MLFVDLDCKYFKKDVYKMIRSKKEAIFLFAIPCFYLYLHLRKIITETLNNFNKEI
jgi:hypothetical protein